MPCKICDTYEEALAYVAEHGGYIRNIFLDKTANIEDRVLVCSVVYRVV